MGSSSSKEGVGTKGRDEAMTVKSGKATRDDKNKKEREKADADVVAQHGSHRGSAKRGVRLEEEEEANQVDHQVGRAWLFAAQQGNVDELRRLIKECGAYVNYGEPGATDADLVKTHDKKQQGKEEQQEDDEELDNDQDNKDGKREAVEAVAEDEEKKEAEPDDNNQNDANSKKNEKKNKKGKKVKAQPFFAIQGDTALHYAAERGHVSCVTFLFYSDAQLESRNKFGSTPLHRAIAANQIACVKALLEKGAQIDQVNKFGNNVFHIAAFGGYNEVLEVLLENRSSHYLLTHRNAAGMLPEDYARKATTLAALKKYKEPSLDRLSSLNFKASPPASTLAIPNTTLSGTGTINALRPTHLPTILDETTNAQSLLGSVSPSSPLLPNTPDALTTITTATATATATTTTTALAIDTDVRLRVDSATVTRLRIHNEPPLSPIHDEDDEKAHFDALRNVAVAGTVAGAIAAASRSSSRQVAGGFVVASRSRSPTTPNFGHPQPSAALPPHTPPVVGAGPTASRSYSRNEHTRNGSTHAFYASYSRRYV